MKRITQNWMKVATVTLGLLGASAQSNAAVVAGTQNPDGSWTLGDWSFSLFRILETDFAPMTDRSMLLHNDMTNASGVGAFIATAPSPDFTFRSATELTIISEGFGDFIYSFNGAFHEGADSGDDNWVILSLDALPGEWDTVIQLSFGTDHNSVADDAIVGVWHDNATSGANILAGISNLNDLKGAVTPEPSSSLLFGIGCLTVVLRRKRF